MNKREIFEHYSSILDELIDNSLFFSTYFQSPYYIADDIFGYDDEVMRNGVSYHTGATRGCLVDEDEDYVVKFDIREDDYGSACEREVEIYRDAVESDLAQYLCEAQYIGTYTHKINFYDYYNIELHMNWCDYEPEYFEKEFAEHEDEFGELQEIVISLPLYAYRRADTFDCGPADAYSKALAEQCESPLKERNIAVATAFIRDYGFEEYERFSEFAEAQGINDIHIANIGSIDSTMRIIDYAGYHDGGY